MAFTEDISAFFDTDDFAVSATVGAATFNVIFDNAYLSAGGDAPVAGTQPMVTARSSDVSSVWIGNTMTINSVAYVVTGIHPDGTGVTVITLRT